MTPLSIGRKLPGAAITSALGRRICHRDRNELFNTMHRRCIDSITPDMRVQKIDSAMEHAPDRMSWSVAKRR